MPRPTFISQVADRLHRDADRAEQITGLVLHELRDRLPEPNAAQIASHLPTALRPMWVDHDRHPGTIYKLEFLGDVMECGAFPNIIEAEQAVLAVFVVLQRRLDRITGNGRAVSAILRHLPDDLAVLWRAAEACGADVYRRGPLPAERSARAVSRSSAA